MGDQTTTADPAVMTMERRQLFRRSLAAGLAAGTVAVGPGVVSASNHYDGWLDQTENYEGTFDFRGRDEVEVAVGAGNGLLFEPPAILVDPGTTVIWEWTGEGGIHNVATVDGPADLESELTDEAGTVYQFTFESEHEGITKYVCEPHEAVHMKGVVAVGVGDQIEDDLIQIDDDEDPDDEPAPGVPLTGLDFLAIGLALGIVGFLIVLPYLLASE